LVIPTQECGRFTHRHTWADIHRMYRLTSPASNVQPNYTVCTTDTVNVVTSFQDTRTLEPMRWVPIPTPVVEAAQRLDEAVHFQRASRDRNDEAVLPRSVQANSLPHPRVRLLGMAGRRPHRCSRMQAADFCNNR
jgi:hypothetical protein